MAITGPMIAVVKRSSLSSAQKLLWLDLVPYKGEGCHKTAKAQAEDIQLAVSTVDQWRRLFVRLGLAIRGEHSMEWGGPRPTWIAAFPADLVPPTSKRGFRDNVIRMAAQLDLRIAFETQGGATDEPPTPMWDDPPTDVAEPTPPCGATRYPDAPISAVSAGGASRGEGGRGEGLAFPSQGERPGFSNIQNSERNSPDGEEEKPARAREVPPVPFDERLTAWQHRLAGGAR